MYFCCILLITVQRYIEGKRMLRSHIIQHRSIDNNNKNLRAHLSVAAETIIRPQCLNRPLILYYLQIWSDRYRASWPLHIQINAWMKCTCRDAALNFNAATYKKFANILSNVEAIVSGTLQ